MRPPIYFYSPSHFEPWDWRNPDTAGIGGSETSHICMALGLASRGYDVTSYSPLPADCPDREHGGVHWRDLADADFAAPGLWILYRCPEIADRFAGATRPDQTLWVVCQDEDYPGAWAEQYRDNTPALVAERQDKLHRVLALCNAQADYYRSRYPGMATRVCVSSNGLRRELVHAVLAEPHAPRHPKRLLYPSSPDRALVPLLDIFWRVREREPDAELWVAYGFDNIDKLVARVEGVPEAERNPADVRHLKWVRWIKKELEKPGVRHFGRLPQRELYRLWRQCGLWAYPVRFRETSAITCMEAQALGAIPIVCPVWAVGENVRYGVHIEEHEPPEPPQGGYVDDPLTLARFTDEIVRLMREPQRQEEIRPPMMAWAQQWFDYNQIVSQWEGWIPC